MRWKDSSDVRWCHTHKLNARHGAAGGKKKRHDTARCPSTHVLESRQAGSVDGPGAAQDDGGRALLDGQRGQDVIAAGHDDAHALGGEKAGHVKPVM